MPTRYILLACCLAAGAFCARLGVWQLDRLAERRAANALVREGLRMPAIDVAELGDTAPPARYQRVRADGVFDYSRDLALAPRALHGSPGAHLVTPMARAGTDTLIPVVRGWVYSPDALTVDFDRWREGDSALVEGYAMVLDTTGDSDEASSRAPRAVRRLDRARLEARYSAPVAGYYIVQTGSRTTGFADSAAAAPARLSEPALGDGPHLSYAVQWFLFATVFGVGGTLVVLRGRGATPRRGDR